MAYFSSKSWEDARATALSKQKQSPFRLRLRYQPRHFKNSSFQYQTCQPGPYFVETKDITLFDPDLRKENYFKSPYGIRLEDQLSTHKLYANRMYFNNTFPTGIIIFIWQ